MHARCAVAIASVLAAASPARAEPRELVTRPLVLPRGELDLRIVAELGIRPNAFARPISFAPDAWYGLTDRWTVGVVHSYQSRGLLDDSSTLCFDGIGPLTCDRAYNGSGVDVRYSARAGALAVAPRGRLLLRDVDPWKPAVTAGALVRWTRGRVAVSTDAYLQLGLANRDRGNRAALVIPLWLSVQPLPRFLVGLHTGWDGELALLRDGWHVPAAIALEVRAYARLHISVEAGFRTLIGPQHDVKSRALALTLAWHP